MRRPPPPPPSSMQGNRWKNGRLKAPPPFSAAVDTLAGFPIMETDRHSAAQRAPLAFLRTGKDQALRAGGSPNASPSWRTFTASSRARSARWRSPPARAKAATWQDSKARARRSVFSMVEPLSATGLKRLLVAKPAQRQKRAAAACVPIGAKLETHARRKLGKQQGANSLHPSAPWPTIGRANVRR
jgi:hypothetical protein